MTRTKTTRPSPESLAADDQSVFFQGPDLAAGCCRVHLGHAGQLADGEVTLLLKAPKQQEPWLRYGHTGNCCPAGVHLAAPVEAKQLLDGTFDGVELRPRLIHLKLCHRLNLYYL